MSLTKDSFTATIALDVESNLVNTTAVFAIYGWKIRTVRTIVRIVAFAVLGDVITLDIATIVECALTLIYSMITIASPANT